jgi:hypothetical protein
MWPEFDAAALDEALSEFSRRERRFGGIPVEDLSRPAALTEGAR